MLYRTFPRVDGAGPADPGGPLFVPRLEQRRGRHDNPDAYGALYLSRVPASPIAEILREYVSRAQPPHPLLREGSPIGLAAIDDSALDELIDLDDPTSLETRDLRPSGVATRNRGRTQKLAMAIFGEGAAGFEWWSAIEAAWINVTLFAERAVERLSVVGEPEALTTEHPAVREAAEAVGVPLV